MGLPEFDPQRLRAAFSLDGNTGVAVSYDSVAMQTSKIKETPSLPVCHICGLEIPEEVLNGQLFERLNWYSNHYKARPNSKEAKKHEEYPYEPVSLITRQQF